MDRKFVPLMVNYGNYACLSAEENAVPIERLLKQIDWHSEKRVAKDELGQDYVEFCGETYTLAFPDECVIEKYPMRIFVDALSCHKFRVRPSHWLRRSRRGKTKGETL